VADVKRPDGSPPWRAERIGAIGRGVPARAMRPRRVRSAAATSRSGTIVNGAEREPIAASNDECLDHKTGMNIYASADAVLL
jgi:hypothetical protein